MSVFAIGEHATPDYQEQRRGEKPHAVPELGPFGCLRGTPPEAVADTVVGPHVGDRATEELAKQRFRWVIGINALDRASLGAAWLDFLIGTGLLTTRLLEGDSGHVRYAERASQKARPRRDINLPPEPVGVEPVAGPDPAAERAKAAELASLDARIDTRLREHGLI